MRSCSLALLLVVACGAPPSPPTAPRVAPAAAAATSLTPAAIWRAALDPITGTWEFRGGDGTETLRYRETCAWIPDATFVLCKAEGSPGVSLIGWEEHNRRYVHWGIGSKGKAHVIWGTIAGTRWAFGAPGERVTMVNTTPDTWTFLAEREEAPGQWRTSLEGTYVRAAP